MRAAGIVQPDNRHANLHRQVENFANFFRVSFGEGTAKDREVLSKDRNATAVDQTIAGNDAIAGIELLVKAKVARAVHDQLVKLFKAVLISRNSIRSRAVICWPRAASPRARRRHPLPP